MSRKDMDEDGELNVNDAVTKKWKDFYWKTSEKTLTTIPAFSNTIAKKAVEAVAIIPDCLLWLKL